MALTMKIGNCLEVGGWGWWCGAWVLVAEDEEVGDGMEIVSEANAVGREGPEAP